MAKAERYAGELQSMVLLDYIAEKRGMSIPSEARSDPDLWAQLRSTASAAGVGSLFRPPTPACRSSTTHPDFRAWRPRDRRHRLRYPQRGSLADNLTAVSARSLNAVGEAVYG